MNKLLLLCLLLLPALLPAQSLTYQRALGDGQAQYNALDYEDAIKKFEAAKLLAKGSTQQTEVAEWLDRAKDGRLNALKRALAKADSLREAVTIEKARTDSALARANYAFQLAESAIAKANLSLSQETFYQGKFGLALKNIGSSDLPDYKFGYVDQERKELIPFKFEEAGKFYPDDGFARVVFKGQKYLLDTNGVQYLLAEKFEELHEKTEAIELNKLSQSSPPINWEAYLNVKVILARNDQEKTGIVDSFLNHISSFQKLQYLDLSHNQLIQLPEEIGTLNQLNTLILSHNNLETLPSTISKLKTLKVLDLSHNSIDSLPSFFEELTGLKIVDLSSNQIAFIPLEIESLQELVYLDISRNRLETFPKQLLALPSLKELSIDGTDFRSESIPKSKKLRITWMKFTCKIFLEEPPE